MALHVNLKSPNHIVVQLNRQKITNKLEGVKYKKDKKPFAQ
jgi:hypothetical protein